ncbi:hypothetical protein LMHOCYYV_CDS0132 [Staphylococcus phage PG-2021_4]
MKSNYLVLTMGVFLILASIVTAMYQDWGQSGSLLIDAFLLIILSIYIKSNSEKDNLIKRQQDDLRSSKKLVDMIAEVQKENEEDDTDINVGRKKDDKEDGGNK